MPLSNPTFEYTTTNIPAFLSKLWTLVEDSKYDELIAWDSSGFSFHVFDQTRFAREILPKFFKHNNMASFIRQLNMYGFRKVNSIDHGSLKNEKEDMEFHHPYFIRGKEQFLEFIKRKVPDIKASANQLSQSANLNTITNPNQQQQLQQQQHQHQQSALTLQYPQIKPDEINKVLEDVNVIKSKQKMVDDSLFNVKKENEALWKEIASLRQKHHHQQQIVNKLIHFLVHLVNPSSLAMKRARPLMIDSHSSYFLNDDADTSDLNTDMNNIENDEDEEYTIDTTSGLNTLNNGFSLNSINSLQKSNALSQQRNIVELEDDEDDEDRLNSNSNSKKRSLDANLVYVNDEIETINARKNTNPIMNTNDSQQPAKKLKSSTTQSNEITTINLYQPKNLNDLKLNIELTNSNGLGSDQQDFLDANLFLNTTRTQTPTLKTESIANTPIVSTPESPLELNANSNSNSNSSMFITETNNNNPNQMNDHVESLQLDLNSIKELLTQNSFNQIDPYTINNLFSPIILDQMENDQYYLEAPLQADMSMASSVRLDSNQAHQFNNSNSPVNSSNSSNNGKIVGNELIEYEPFNAADYFQIDDLFSNDVKIPASSSSPKRSK